MKPYFLIALVALTACQAEPAGEAIIRTEIGQGDEETLDAAYPEGADGLAATHQAQSPCQVISFEDAQFTHCIADPEHHQIEMALRDQTGKPYRSLRQLANHLGDDAAGLAFAVNGGMFDGDGIPIGYYVEGGNRLQPLNRNGGTGNFHMLPNGVFFGTQGKWQILATERFYSEIAERPEFGTQSGPMLIIDGAIHPQITHDGPSRAIRNGVGVDADGRAHFVISQQPVSFGKLARLFRDQLKTENALFLDGNVSSLWDPAMQQIDDHAKIGPIITVWNRNSP